MNCNEPGGNGRRMRKVWYTVKDKTRQAHRVYLKHQHQSTLNKSPNENITSEESGTGDNEVPENAPQKTPNEAQPTNNDRNP